MPLGRTTLVWTVPQYHHSNRASAAVMLKARSHGVAAAAIFLPQQMGCIGFNVSVHTAAVAAMMPQVNGFGTHFVGLRQQHHEGSPDSGTLKSLNFSNFWTF